jgi:hypothetical protein
VRRVAPKRKTVVPDYGGEEARLVEPAGGDSQNKRNADQLGMEVIGMLWEVGVERFC